MHDTERAPMSAPASLVMRRAALGDFILTLPVVEALAALGPVLVATHPRFAPLLPPGAALHDDAWLWRGVPPPVPIARAFAFGAVAAGALRAAGIGTVHAVAALPPGGVPAVVHYAAVLGAHSWGPRGPVPRVAVAAGDPAYAPGGIVIAPGSGGAAKRWPLARWHAVASALESHGRRVIWVRGPDELHETDWPVDAACPSIEGLVTLLRGADAFLGPDSGPAHLAAAIAAGSASRGGGRRPSYVGVVFGPTDPAVWAPVDADVWPWDTDPDLLAASVDAFLRIADAARPEAGGAPR